MGTTPAVTPRALHKRRASVLEFIRHEMASGRPFPGTAVIARHMGWLPGSALDALYRLACDGCIRKVGRCTRTGKIAWELVESTAGESREAAQAPAPPAGEAPGPAGVGNGVGNGVCARRLT